MQGTREGGKLRSITFRFCSFFFVEGGGSCKAGIDEQGLSLPSSVVESTVESLFSSHIFMELRELRLITFQII